MGRQGNDGGVGQEREEKRKARIWGRGKWRVGMTAKKRRGSVNWRLGGEEDWEEKNEEGDV